MNRRLNLIKYTIGLPVMVIVAILQLFYVLKLIAISNPFAIYNWRKLVSMFKPYE